MSKRAAPQDVYSIMISRSIHYVYLENSLPWIFLVKNTTHTLHVHRLHKIYVYNACVYVPLVASSTKGVIIASRLVLCSCSAFGRHTVGRGYNIIVLWGWYSRSDQLFCHFARSSPRTSTYLVHPPRLQPSTALATISRFHGFHRSVHFSSGPPHHYHPSPPPPIPGIPI